MTDNLAHTRPRAETNLDHHSLEFQQDPHGALRTIRESGCPVAHSDRHGGFWTLTDYASVYAASRDNGLFNSIPR